MYIAYMYIEPWLDNQSKRLKNLNLNLEIDLV